MLNPKTLENQIKNALEQYLPPAFENAMFGMIDADGDEVRERCKNFGQTVSDMLSEPLASSIAAAIDYYVKNISISGTILTTGTPVAQQAVIVSPSPLTNGVIPNSLKIQ